MMLLTLRGTPVLYYGDEIGLPDLPLDPAHALDPVPRRSGRPERSRDPGRTPMPWTAGEGAGFTEPGVEPWLPIGDAAAHNVAAQREDPVSTLHLVRDLIALRRDRADLRSGAYTSLPAPDGAWAWRRGDGLAVALNLAGADAPVAGLEGRIVLATDRARDGEAVGGDLTLGPWQGVIVELSR